MICADLLAGTNLDNEDPETLLFWMSRIFRCLPETQKKTFLEKGLRESIVKGIRPKTPRLQLGSDAYEKLKKTSVPVAMADAVKPAVQCQTLRFITKNSAVIPGMPQS